MPRKGWRPPSVRYSEEARRDYDALTEGVPSWLESSLLKWVEPFFPSGKTLEYTLQEIERALRIGLSWHHGTDSAYESLFKQIRADDELFFGLIDFWLHDESVAESRFNGYVDGDLKDYLEEAGSAWTVVPQEQGFRLERRVAPEMRTLAETAMDQPGNAGRYLRLAWEAGFGRDPQADKAFLHAVSAMEAALAPIVSPKDPKPTLGTMIRNLKDAPEKWEARLGGRDAGSAAMALADYLDVVWKSHLRHGLAEGQKISHEPDEARDAVVIAAHVVYLTNSDAFTPAPARRRG